MKAKTIFIIIITVLVTIVLMKNTDEVIFWIFGFYSVPKLLVLGIMFILGFIIGFLARGKKRAKASYTVTQTEQQTPLDDTDRDYLQD